MNKSLPKEYEFCLRCGRRLKTPDSRLKGYGVICEKKMKTSTRKRLFYPISK